MAEENKQSALSVPLNEDGTIGTLPEQLQKLMDSRITQAVERARKGATTLSNPVEVERLRQLEEENKAFKVAEAERQQKYDEALRIREGDWKKTTDAQKAELDRRTTRIVELLGAEIRAAAVKHGARTESLEDLAVIARGRVQLSEDLQPVVVGDDGKPTDLTIEAYVQKLLEAKPYFRSASGGAGGGARGGASLSGQAVGLTERVEAAKLKLARNPRDAQAQQEFMAAQAELKKAG